MQPLVEAFLHHDSHTWTYLVADPARGETVIIDPVLDYDAAAARTGTTSAERLLARVSERGWTVAWILETHAHADHLSAGDWLRRRCGAPLAIGAGIVDVQRHFATLFDLDDLPCDGSQFDRLWNDGDALRVGAIEGRVIATPGHTPDGMSYLIGDALFVGDTLFMPDSGTARCDFPGGDAATLHRSISRLFELPDATRVFVCHDYGTGGREHRHLTSIGEQKRHNIHLAGADAAQFQALRRARDATLAVPALLLPALQVNIRAGALPPAAGNGVRYLKLPLDQLQG
jgi:glyoxylase-like metal-dependent hydrolase (beta-lactamase superfamily II)